MITVTKGKGRIVLHGPDNQSAMLTKQNGYWLLNPGQTPSSEPIRFEDLADILEAWSTQFKQDRGDFS